MLLAKLVPFMPIMVVISIQMRGPWGKSVVNIFILYVSRHPNFGDQRPLGATKYTWICGNLILIDPLKPLASKEGDPIFEAAWQAEVLGMADLLVQNGLFTASDWAENLGVAVRKEEDTTEGYYRAVLSTIETLLEKNGLSKSLLDQTVADWKSAYERTPHGEPVTLD